MKKATLILFAFLLSASYASAQKVELTPFYGWQFGGTIDVTRGTLLFPASGSWGFTLDVKVTDEGFVEFLYSRQDTTMRFQKGGVGPSEELFDVAVEYYQGGGGLEFGDGPARPFLALGLGATRLAAKPSELGSEWRFSTSIAGGVKVLASEHVGFRIEGRLLLPFYGTGFTVGCGGGGCFTSVGGWISTAQGNLNAGLIIAF